MAIGTFTTEPRDFPAGTVAAGYLLTLTDTTSGATLTAVGSLDARSITIDNVPPGTYHGTIALVDTSHNPLSSAVDAVADLVVPPVITTVTFEVPNNLVLS